MGDYALQLSFSYHLIHLLQLLFVVSGKQRISLEPKDVTVRLHSNTTLPCRVEDQAGPVQWSQNGFALGQDRNLPGFPRYRMTGSSALGEYNLEIANIQLTDDSYYQCQVGATESEEPLKSRDVRITVLVPPSAPKIVNYGDVITAELGKQYTVSCSTEDGKPAPRIHWAVAKDVEGKQLIRSLPSPQKPIVSNINILYSVRSDLRYEPLKMDSGHYLVCLVRHPALDKPLNTAAKLRVQYKPEIDIRLNGAVGISSRPREGQDVKLLCYVLDASPRSHIQYKWTANGRVFGRNSSLAIQNVHLDTHHNTTFKCNASNAVGFAAATYTLEIEYGPRITRLNKRLVHVDEGDDTELQCEVDSNPKTEIVWTFGESDDIIHQGSSLVITDATLENEGRYFCRAEVDGFLPAKKSFAVYINGPPSVYLHSSYEGNKGSRIQMICRVHGEPPPTNPVVWYKRHSCKDGGEWIPLRDMLSDEARSRYTWGPKSGNKDGIRVYILQIDNILESDFGCYNCTAINSYGADSAATELLEGEFLPLYYMIPVTIIGGVLVIALFIACICFNRRYCCQSTKSSHRSDDRDSDVVVKCESLDGSGIPLHRYYPDMYATGASQATDYSGQDYMPIPATDQCDIDNLPPPYATPVNYYANQSTPTITFATNNDSSTSSTNGHLVHMTYLDGSPQRVTDAPQLTTQTPIGIAHPHPHYSASDYSVLAGVQKVPYIDGGAGVVGNVYKTDCFSADALYQGGSSLQPIPVQVNGFAPGPQPVQTFQSPNKPTSLSGLCLTPNHQPAGAVPINVSDYQLQQQNILTSAEALLSPSHCAPLETLHEVPTPDTEYPTTISEIRTDSQQSTHV